MDQPYELGTVMPYQAALHVKPCTTPSSSNLVLHVPFAINNAIGQELNSMEKQATVIENIDDSEWTAPIVAVPKKDSNFHICGDPKITINQSFEVDQ